MSRLSISDRAQQMVTPFLYPGAMAIDMTAGNGFDTVFLAMHVGSHGRVVAFDTQPAAIDSTRNRLLENRLENVTLVLGSHANFPVHLPAECQGHLAACMWNLGYLPRGNKSLTTDRTSTCQSILFALEWIHQKGCLCIVAYTGHPGGAEEAEAVRELLQSRELLPNWKLSQFPVDPLPGQPIIFFVCAVD